MFALTAAMGVIGLAIASDYSGDVNIGFGAPLLVDLFSWYTIGAIAGVFPVPF